MQGEDNIFNELEANDISAKKEVQAVKEDMPQQAKAKSGFMLDRRQKGMIAMGAVVVLGLAVIFAPGLLTTKSQPHKALQPVELQGNEPQDSAGLQPVAKPLVQEPAEPEVQKELNALHTQVDDLKTLDEVQLSLLRQLIQQNQSNNDSLIGAIKQETDALRQEAAQSAASTLKSPGTKLSRPAPAQRLPHFKINTIYNDEAWLTLNQMTYAVMPGDTVFNGIRIISIDAENRTVTTSAGVIH